MKKKRTNYVTIQLNLGNERKRTYIENLRRRYDRPRSGLARLVICALREVLYLQEQGILAHGPTTTEE